LIVIEWVWLHLLHPVLIAPEKLASHEWLFARTSLRSIFVRPLFNQPGTRISDLGPCTPPRHQFSYRIRDIMQLQFLFVGTFLPLGLMASTVELEVEPRAAISRPQHYSIVGNSEKVKCRTRPGTKWDVRTTLRRGHAYDFGVCSQSNALLSVGAPTSRSCPNVVATRFVVIRGFGVDGLV